VSQSLQVMYSNFDLNLCKPKIKSLFSSKWPCWLWFSPSDHKDICLTSQMSVVVTSPRATGCFSHPVQPSYPWGQPTARTQARQPASVSISMRISGLIGPKAFALEGPKAGRVCWRKGFSLKHALDIEYSHAFHISTFWQLLLLASL